VRDDFDRPNLTSDPPRRSEAREIPRDTPASSWRDPSESLWSRLFGSKTHV